VVVVPKRFPAIEPYDTGMLDVGDGQFIYWEVSGNPDGKPAVALHGGPGSGSTPGRRRSFNPDAYRFVQFDQRGCGRSTPSVADLSTSLDTNTTEHLIGDIEKLREHLGIGRWLVWGGSWGVTLGLAYAQRYPERVAEMVLVSCTMTRPCDVHWLYHETGRFFPEQWQRYSDGGGNERADLRHDPFHRPCTAIAARLGAEFAEFPGGHLAPMELPAPFAAGLRDVFGRL
jgi:proline iminopeptidase